ncbi:MAG: trypsin-like serine protease [Bdellovibrionaceae bacterium]|nr:trypsin-like serine protease [Pseudobdellovibrionaceae bacterium]
MSVKHGCLYILVGLASLLVSCQEPSARRASDEQRSTPKGPERKVFPYDSARGCYMDAIVNGSIADQNTPLKNHIVMLITSFKRNDETLSTLCTGTLIDNNTVLTAAHCFPKNRVSTQVIASINLFCSSGFNHQLAYTASNVMIHPKYIHKDTPSGVSPDFDIALVKFEGILPHEYMPLAIQKIDIQSEMKNSSSHMVMTGFGRTSTSDSSLPELRYLSKPWDRLILFKDSVNLVDRLNLVSVNQTDARGGCSGDSGGPLLIEDNGTYKILGVASYIESSSESRLCEQGQIFYSYITSYLEWINESML